MTHVRSPGSEDILRKRPKPHYVGHRMRLKERFLKYPSGLPDYELLEVLLYAVYPRRDVKPLAKELLTHFESFARLCSATPDQLSCVNAQSAFVILQLVKEVSRRLLYEELRQQPLLNNAERVINYCHLVMAYESVEQFRIFFLDKKNYLIADEVQQTGTLDTTPLYPREVMKRALALNASGLIMVHNHPSGDPAPSKADIDITRHMQECLGPFQIRVLDHFIIGRFGYFSFRQQQLL